MFLCNFLLFLRNYDSIRLPVFLGAMWLPRTTITTMALLGGGDDLGSGGRAGEVACNKLQGIGLQREAASAAWTRRRIAEQVGQERIGGAAVECEPCK